MNGDVLGSGNPEPYFVTSNVNNRHNGGNNRRNVNNGRNTNNANHNNKNNSFNRRSNQNRSDTSDMDGSKNYKKKEDYIEYHFSDNVGEIKRVKPYLDVEIPAEKIRKIFEQFREKFGETEIIKEYSTYKHNDMELTVFPDGSSFCRQVIVREVQDEKVPSGICVIYKEKFKISNDYFPCKYIYNSSVDVIDVIFNVTNDIDEAKASSTHRGGRTTSFASSPYDIKIVLSTTYENNRTVEKVKKVESLGRPNKIKKSKNAWCELYVTVGCSCDVEDVHNTINFVKEIMNEM
jgi:hypothetical protein